MSCIEISYELYLYLLFKETSRLEDQGYDLRTAFQHAAQEYKHWRIRGRPVFYKVVKSEHLPSHNNDNKG
jgi:hypothetical protein